MKKVLLASTALVAFAGAASAEVALSGSAEMGIYGGQAIVYDDAANTIGVESIETQFHTHIDVTFTLSGETDSGISFGASVDLDEADNINGGSDDGVAIFISGDFGTLTMGDTDGAMDFILTEASVGNAGSIRDDETAHVGWIGSYLDGAYDGQILRYSYSMAGFTGAVSVELDDSGNRDTGFALGASYGGDFGGGSYTVGLAYQYADPRDTWNPGNISSDVVDFVTNDFSTGMGAFVDDVTSIGVSATVALDAGFSAGVLYVMSESDGSAPVAGTNFDSTYAAVSAGYTFDAITVSANYGILDIDNFGEFSGYGLAAAYDLGGGLTAQLGYGSSNYDVDVTALGGNAFDDTINTFSLGLSMSF